MGILLSEIFQLRAAPVWEGRFCLTPTCSLQSLSLLVLVPIYRQSFFLPLSSLLLVQISCFIHTLIVPNLKRLKNIIEIPLSRFAFSNKIFWCLSAVALLIYLCRTPLLVHIQNYKSS